MARSMRQSRTHPNLDITTDMAKSPKKAPATKSKSAAKLRDLPPKKDAKAGARVEEEKSK